MLQTFLHNNPFCVDGLAVMAEHFRIERADYQARQFLRRAVYTIECAFNTKFSPFQETGVGASAVRPRVALKLSRNLDWPGWTWLRVLWMYMQDLMGKSAFRTALEVCKLILSATLPRDPTHVLVCVDFLFIRSKRFDELIEFVAKLAPQHGLEGSGASHASFRLDFAMPNFAYSVALAQLLQLQLDSEALLSAVNCVSVAAVISNEGDQAFSEDMTASVQGCARLMRALLFFPVALRPILEEADVSLQSAPANSLSKDSWSTLLLQTPFSDATDFRHATHRQTRSTTTACCAGTGSGSTFT